MFPENSSIWKTFYDACGRNTRVLEKLMRRSARIAEVNASKTLQPEHVLEARKMLIV
jgi:Cdc6-like AAA superfamily ATPase